MIVEEQKKIIQEIKIKPCNKRVIGKIKVGSLAEDDRKEIRWKMLLLKITGMLDKSWGSKF